MKYKIAATGLMVLSLTTCSSPASATVSPQINIEKPVSTFSLTSLTSKNHDLTNVTLLGSQYLKNQSLMAEGIRVNKVLAKLKKTVGKTWYVFSGNTPNGWDCSGLTMWFYEQLNISLEHRASKQQNVGIATKNPKPGDIVVFKYKGYKFAYHVGIYIGNGQMIHAPRKGEATRIESISKFGGNYSNISYRSLVEVL